MTAEQLRGALAKLWREMADFRCAGSEMTADAVHMYMRDYSDQLRTIAARLSGMAAAPQWRSIETAPRDGRARIELWIPEPTGPGYPTHGHWNSDHRARRPRPFWYYESTPSARDMRDWQPTHWRPESEPPHV